MKNFPVLALLTCLLSFAVVPASAQTLSIVSGNNQAITVTSTSSTPLVVTICQTGEVACGGRTGANIVFQVQAANPAEDSNYASLCSTTSSCAGTSLTVAIPPEGSQAAAYIQAGPLPGSYNVTATIQGTNTSVTFSVTNLTGPPALLGFQETDQAYQGQQLYLTVQVFDSQYNPIPGPYPVTLTAPSTEPSGKFGGSRTTTLQVTNGSATGIMTVDYSSGSFTVQVAASCSFCTGAIAVTVVPNVNVTFNTSPPGLAFAVDGQSYQSSKTLSLAPTSQHTLTAPSPQTTVAGQGGATESATWDFASWNVAVQSNGSFYVSSTDETITGTYQAVGVTQYLLSASASPSSQGSLSASPPASDGSYSSGTYSGHYNAGTVVQLTATPAPGYVFLNWGGALSGSTNPQSVTINSQTDLTAFFAPAIPTTIATNPPGLSISVDGQTYTAPQTLQWTQMSQHTIGTSSPQTGAGGAHDTFSNWSDGGAISHTVSVGAAAATYTANFTQSVSPLSFTCGAAGSAQVGTNYSLTCTASGGLSPYTFTVSAGSLPLGLNLTSSGAAATLAGSPTTAGAYNFTLKAADNSTPALVATQSISLTVAALPSVLSVSPAAGLTFTAYQGRSSPSAQNLSLTSTGGSTTFTVTNWPSWAQVTPSSGATPAILNVTANTAGLPIGPVVGSITIAPASGQPLSVNVQANVAAFSISAANAITENLPAGATKNDSLAVTTVDNGPATVQAAATASGGNWLKLPSATLSAPGALAYTIDATGLSGGAYTGAINLTCAAANPCAAVAVAVNLTVSAGTPTVTIAQVLNAAGEAAAISQNTWIEIKGTGLSQTTRPWQSSDFDPTTGLMPTQLDGVSVLVNGKPAYVYYISPSQINVLSPLDSALGTVGVQVMNSVGTSAVANVTMLADSLGLFAFNSGTYAAATHVDGSLLGPTSLYPGYTTPAKPGETIVLYGNGFGQTDPPVTLGLALQSGTLPHDPVVTIGGLPANVIFAGVVSPGLYQFNVVVPATAPSGDLPVLATYAGVGTQTGVVITVAQ